MKNIYLVKNDLRIQDNQALQLAAQANHLNIVYLWPDDFEDWGSCRQGFLVQSLLAFEASLQCLGQKLYIFKSSDPQDLVNLLTDFQRLVHSSAYNEKDHLNWLAIKSVASQLKVESHSIGQSCLYEPQDLPFLVADLPLIFTQYRKKIDHKKVNFVSCDIKTLPPPSDINLLEAIDFLKSINKQTTNKNFQGGEKSGLQRLHYYLWESDSIQTYKETRNGMLRYDDSSKLSPWLALGCISPKRIYCEILSYEKQIMANDSTYWLYFELLWRDYFKLLSLKFGSSIFDSQGLQNKKLRLMPKELEQNQLEKWKLGQTGNDFIDANMLELLNTGWMSNRGRQNVASYLAKELEVNWTLGASWFEKQLLDYDPESNWCNWAYLAGVGVDPRDRKFNIDRQAQMYDGDRAYRNKFLKLAQPSHNNN